MQESMENPTNYRPTSCIDIYLKDVCKYDVLSPDEEKKLSILSYGGCRKAREKMVQHNLRLVVSIANDFNRKAKKNSIIEDLICEGNVGLAIAVERFDPYRGVRFATYATYWIRLKVIKFFENKYRIIRLPVNKSQKIRDLLALKHKNIGTLTNQELAKQTNMNESVVNMLLQDNKFMLSLDFEIEQEAQTTRVTFGETIPDESQEPVHFSLSKREDRVELKKAVEQSLSKKEREILSFRFGLNDHEPVTLQELGKRFSVSRERIRQLENQAIKKLKRYFHRLTHPLNPCVA